MIFMMIMVFEVTFDILSIRANLKIELKLTSKELQVVGRK